MNNTAFVVGATYHQFEIAGLGPAPYTLVGVRQSIYKAAPDAPSQPGSCCDYCGTAITNVFELRAANGRVFKVGGDCVLKTDSPKALRVAVLNERQRLERERRQAKAAAGRARDLARVAAAKALLPAVADTFRAQPHPQAASFPFLADKTRLDWAEWMLAHAGLTGQVMVAKAIEGAVR
jgi:hypothetical protein